MKRSAYYLVMFLSFLCSISTVYASHVAGSEITYTCVGPNQYQVKLVIYRDCAGIASPSSTTINYSSVTCGVSASVQLNHQSTVDITPLCGSASSACNGGGGPLGIEQITYSGILNLPNGCSDWVLRYSECCRNGQVSNLNLPSSQDIYVQSTLNNTVSGCNSSPQFTSVPQLFGCVGNTINFQQLANDPDGDVLVYSLVNASQAAGTSVNYAGGFTGSNPFTDPVTIDSNTGQITVTPSSPQVAVISILVQEYRGGVLIGSVIRDLQINITNCTNNIPNLGGINGVPNDYDISICAGSSVCFTIPITDADAAQVVNATLSNLPAGATVNITGTGNNKTATICWTSTTADIGSHYFLLNAVDNACPIIGQQSNVYEIIVTANPNGPVNAGLDIALCAGQSTNLNVTTGAGAVSSISWSPGLSLSNPSASNPTATPSATTNYTATVTYSDGCVSNDVVQVAINDDPVASVSPGTYNVCPGGNVQLTGLTDANGMTFQWFNPSMASLGSGTISGTTSTIVVTVPASSGNYNYTFTVTNPITGCSSSAIATLIVGAPPALANCLNIYASPTGSAGNPGTQASPTSLAQALNMANCNNAVIKLAIGTYNITSPLYIGSFVTLEGGFDPGNAWTKTSQAGATTINRTTANPEGAANAQRLVAFYANSATNFRLQDLTITTAAANLNGESTYAVHLTNCSNYNIVRTQLLPGAARQGAAGAIGAAGANGSNGGAGLNGDDDNDTAENPGGTGGNGCGGTAGAGQCSAPGQNNGCTGNTGTTAALSVRGGGGGSGGGGGNEARDGGRGGYGGGVPAGGGFLAIGQNTVPSSAAGCGRTTGDWWGNETGCNGASLNANSGESGRCGNNGQNGGTGTAGTAGPAGSHVGGFFVPGGQGGTGLQGQGGQGGSGGGGGAGEGGTFCTDGTGSGGGGGGGGGCGGEGGTGGRGGGGSFGLYCVASGTGTITQCNIAAGAAGAGGAGGAGGIGGTGGTGGARGVPVPDPEVGFGGVGGNGGNGGPGGAGGAGQAGQTTNVFGVAPSYSFFNLAAQPVIQVSNVNCTNTNVNYTALGSNNWDFDAVTNFATPATAIGANVLTQYTQINRYSPAFGANLYSGFHNISFDGSIIPDIVSSALQVAPDVYQVCQGEFANFQSLYSADSYQWNFGGAIANPGSTQIVNGQFNTPGYFTITLNLITDCCGLSSTKTVFLHVLATPSVTGSGPAALCAGQSVTLTVNGLTANNILNWSPTTNISGQTSNTLTVNPSGNVTYIATITSTQTAGGNTVTGCPVNLSFPVAVNPIPNPNLTANNLACSNDGSVVSIPTPGGFYNYTWSNGFNTVNSGSSSNTGLSPGNYSVTVTNAATGCQNTASAMVFPSASQPNLIMTSNAAACEGSNTGEASVTTVGGTPNYSINFAGTNYPNTSTVNETNLAAGTYTVVVTDNLGCSSSLLVQVPESLNPHAMVNAGVYIPCESPGAIFYYEGTDGAILTYNDGGVNQTVVLSHHMDSIVLPGLPPSVTLNLVSVNDANCNLPLGNSLVMVVDPCPLGVTLLNFAANCSDDLVKFTWQTAAEENNDFFTLEGSTNGTSFSEIAIIDGAGTSQSTNNYSYQFNRSISGFNYFRLAQTDFDGTRTEHQTIFVNCDNKNDNLIVYPNPSNGQFTIELNLESSSENTAISILDMSGKRVKSFENLQAQQFNTYFIDASDLAPAIYILRIEPENQEPLTTRIRIE